MISKRNILILTSSVFLSCADQQQSSSVMLFNNHHFALADGESVIPADSAVAATYRLRYNNQNDLQIPLYRMIRGTSNYLLFVAVPFHTSVDRIAAARRKVAADTVFADTSDTREFYRYYRSGKKYCAEWVFAMDSASMICIFGETSDPGTADSVMSLSRMKMRISR